MNGDGENNARWSNLPDTSTDGVITAPLSPPVANTSTTINTTLTTTAATPPSSAARRGPNLVYWLRGLPFQAQRADVEAFLHGIDFSRLDIGVLENGECSGNAFVELKGSKHQAELERLHNAFIVIHAHASVAAELRPKPRFVEVMPSNPAKRLEQLEHDRSLPRDATRRQRRLQSGADNIDYDSFNPHGGMPTLASMQPVMMTNLLTPVRAGMQPASIGFTTTTTTLGPPPPPQTSYYIPYGMQLTAAPAVTTHFVPAYANYTAPANLPAMVPYPAHFVDGTAARGPPQGYSIAYDYLTPVHTTPYYAQPIALRPPPPPPSLSQWQQQQRQRRAEPQQQRSAAPTMTTTTPNPPPPPALPPSYN